MMFTWRYYRFFVNLYGFWRYKPSPIPDKPTIHPKAQPNYSVPTQAPCVMPHHVVSNQTRAYLYLAPAFC